jgi:acid phosphatase family membrane protein YuiD
MNTLDIVNQYKLRAKEYALEFGIDNSHVIDLMASVMMTRDEKGISGGSFVQAVVNNNLLEAVTKADTTSLTYLRVIVATNAFCYLD